MSAHIAVYHVPDAGLVNPPLGVVAELVSRGHRVSCATTDEFAAAVRRTGGTAVPYRSTMDLRARANRPSAGRPFAAEDLGELLTLLVTEAVAVLPQLLRTYRTDPPDLVIYDGPIGWAGRLLADRLGVPAVQSRTMFAANEHWSIASVHTDIGADCVEADRAMAAVDALLRRLRSGIQAAELVFDRLADQTLVFLTRSFQTCGDTFADRFHFVGPCLSARAESVRGSDGWCPPPGDGPLALVSLGTLYNNRPEVFRVCVETFRRLPWRAVLSIGPEVAEAQLGPIPANVQVRRTVPQLEVLRHADLFISQAGLCGLMESFHFGVPVIAIPQMSEQRATADRLTELGLGEQVQAEELTPDSLAEAVEFVHGSELVRARIDAMRRDIRAAGGVDAAVAVVEQTLRGTDGG